MRLWFVEKRELRAKRWGLWRPVWGEHHDTQSYAQKIVQCYEERRETDAEYRVRPWVRWEP